MRPEPVATIDTIEPRDRERAVATLTMAFAADPVVRWVFRDSRAYSSLWPPFIDAYEGAAFGRGTGQAIGDFGAVALWLPPGVHSDDATMEALAREGADASTRADLDGFLSEMDRHHPSVDVWYLPLIGVDPPSQGQGFGSALLRHALEVVDRDGVPAYLEATSLEAGTCTCASGSRKWASSSTAAPRRCGRCSGDRASPSRTWRALRLPRCDAAPRAPSFGGVHWREVGAGDGIRTRDILLGK